MRKPGGLVVEYKSVNETQTTLSGAHVWSWLVEGSRATGTNGLSSAFLSALLVGFDRPLTPKELFQQSYSNPAWPLLISDDQLRQAIFELLRGDWMLVDSDSNEIVVSSAGQIQSASMQQVLARRPAAGPTVTPTDEIGDDDSSSADVDGTPDSSPDASPDGAAPAFTPTSTQYERTTVSVTYTSLTDPDVRDRTWRIVRELASIIDPGNAGKFGAEMVGFEFRVSNGGRRDCKPRQSSGSVTGRLRVG